MKINTARYYAAHWEGTHFSFTVTFPIPGRVFPSFLHAKPLHSNARCWSRQLPGHSRDQSQAGKVRKNRWRLRLPLLDMESTLSFVVTCEAGESDLGASCLGLDYLTQKYHGLYFSPGVFQLFLKVRWSICHSTKQKYPHQLLSWKAPIYLLNLHLDAIFSLTTLTTHTHTEPSFEHFYPIRCVITSLLPTDCKCCSLALTSTCCRGHSLPHKKSHQCAVTACSYLAENVYLNGLTTSGCIETSFSVPFFQPSNKHLHQGWSLTKTF